MFLSDDTVQSESHAFLCLVSRQDYNGQKTAYDNRIQGFLPLSTTVLSI